MPGLYWRSFASLEGPDASLKESREVKPLSSGHGDVLVEQTSGYRLICAMDPDTGDSDTAGDIRIVAVSGSGQQT